jgi:serine/threonine protein kinase
LWQDDATGRGWKLVDQEHGRSADEPTRPLLSQGEAVDHYEVGRFLGRGGMGEVYLARDTKLGRKVALKLVHAAALGREDAVERFLHEARTTAQFSHPHIVTIYAVGEVELVAADGKEPKTALPPPSRCPYVALE